MAALSHVVGEETELVRAGKLSDAMEREPRKTELAGIYMRGVEQVKLNAVALARFVPDQVKRLKSAHVAFQDLIEINQIVLATARAVSESIVRDLAVRGESSDRGLPATDRRQLWEPAPLSGRTPGRWWSRGVSETGKAGKLYFPVKSCVPKRRLPRQSSKFT